MADASSRGPTGYGCREFVVVPGLDKKLHGDRLMRGIRPFGEQNVKRRLYLTDENVEIFTRTKEWPFTVVETPYGALDVADILQR